MELYKTSFVTEKKNVLILSYLHIFKIAAHEYHVVAHLVWLCRPTASCCHGFKISAIPDANNFGLAYSPSIYYSHVCRSV